MVKCVAEDTRLHVHAAFTMCVCAGMAGRAERTYDPSIDETMPFTPLITEAASAHDHIVRESQVQKCIHCLSRMHVSWRLIECIWTCVGVHHRGDPRTGIGGSVAGACCDAIHSCFVSHTSCTQVSKRYSEFEAFVATIKVGLHWALVHACVNGDIVCLR